MSYKIRVKELKQMCDLGKMTERECQILELLFLDGLKMKEIAKKIGISSRALNQSWRKLDIKFDGLRQRIKDLKIYCNNMQGSPRKYRQSDLADAAITEDEDPILQNLGDEYVYLHGKNEKVIGKW